MSPAAQLNAALTGRYEIEREIGRGGMATVYLARDLRHQRRVALKVLDPELGAVLGADRFLSEIRVTANLQHPNLLPLFDSGEAGGLLFYVMPFVEGETLRARIDREKQLPIAEAVRIASAVASALDYAHRHGVIHRDLKPENILLHEGQPLVADFGIALAVSNAGGQRVTQTGLSLGTPQYMSPEQATGDRGIDSRTDIYSLGALTYEMLAGEPPHSGPTSQAIIAKLMTEEPRSLTVRRSVPPHVDDAVRCALEKLPADRPATANAFADALSNPASTLTRGHHVATSRSPAWRRAAVPLAGSLAVIATLVAAWALTQLSREPARPVLRNIVTLDDDDEGMGSGAFGRIDISPGGSHIVYVKGPSGPLMLRDRSRLESTLLPGTAGAEAPVFSPDGERIAFITDNGLKVVSTRGGPPITITDSIVGRAGFSWGPDGYLYVDGSGQVALARVRAQPGAVPEWFTTLDSAKGEVDHLWPNVLPNGKGVLFTIAYRSKGIAGAAIGVASTKTGKHTTLLTGLYPRYAASGHLLYVTANQTLMMVPFDQRSLEIRGEPTAVVEGVRMGVLRGEFAVSRSGALLYVLGARQERELVWVSRTGAVQPVDPSWLGAFSEPALSPDGTRLALTVDGENGREIWTKELDTGPAQKLTVDGGGRFPAWTPDGRSLSFGALGERGFRLWTQRADGSSAPVQLVKADQEFADPLWSPDGKWVVFRTRADGQRMGDIYGLRPGVDSAPIPLVAGPFQELAPVISPDGRWLAYESGESGRSQVYVVPFPDTKSAKWVVSSNGGAKPVWARRGGELFYYANGSVVSVKVRTDPTFSVGQTTVLFPWPEINAGTTRRQFEVAPDDSRFLMLRAVAGAGQQEKVVIVDNWFEELKSKTPRR